MSAELSGGTFESLLDPLGWMLYCLRVALDEGPPARPPRWVRIAAASVLPAEHPGHRTARAACTAWIELVAALHELVLDLIDLLDPITADRKALERTLRDLRSQLPVLRASFGKLLPDVTLTLDALQRPLDALILGVDLMPDGEDARALGHQIYALLSVKPTPAPQRPLSLHVPSAIDIDGTGRLRLLQWAYDLPWPLRGVGETVDNPSKTVPVKRLGARWLWEGPNEDQCPVGLAYWADGTGARSVSVMELLFNEAEPREAARTEDLSSLHELLETLGYFAGPVEDELRVTFHPALAQALEVFQALHGLPRTRALDADTLNQLLHLDSRAMTVRRALPLDPERWAAVPAPPPLPPKIVLKEETRTYDVTLYEATPVTGGVHGQLPLINPEADTPHEEGSSPEHSSLHLPGASAAQLQAGSSYGWYVVGAPVREGLVRLPPGVVRGWIRHSGEPDPVDGKPIGEGFVAIQRRGAEVEGGDAEGTTHSGDYFFAARHQAPSMAGRTASPARLLWSPPTLEPGALLGIYQWYDLSSLWNLCRGDGSVTLRGRAAFRVGVTAAGPTPAGRIVIALVRRDAWERRRYASVYTADAVLDKRQTDWFPDDPSQIAAWRTMKARGAAGQAAVASRWIVRQTPDWTCEITAVAPVLYVGLYGRSPGSEDVAAYFDKVVVEWIRHAAHGGRR